MFLSSVPAGGWNKQPQLKSVELLDKTFLRLVACPALT